MKRMSSRGLGPRTAAGFTLLEAIVALTLIATSGLALMAWINTGIAEAARLQERDAQAQLKLAATQFVQTVNPLAQPEGEIEMGALRVRWRAEPDGAATTSAAFVGAGLGQFRMQLFSTRVQARDLASAVDVEFTATLLGYRYVGAGRTGG